LDASGIEQGAGADEESVRPIAHKSRDRCIDLAGSVGGEDPDLEPHRAGCRFHVSHRDLGNPCIVRFDEQRNTGGPRHHFPQKFKPFRRQFLREPIDACHVAAWPGDAGDKTKPDRVFAGTEDDGKRRGCRLSR
jgi:hypothetical protein